jgi:hypothetical protein
VTEALGPATPPLLPLPLRSQIQKMKKRKKKKKGLTYSQLLLSELPLLKGK